MNLKRLGGAAVACGALVSAPVALAAPLACHAHLSIISPSHVSVSAHDTSGRDLRVMEMITCPDSHHRSVYVQRPGTTRPITLPARHKGRCDITVTASVAGYGSMNIALHARGR